MSHRRSRRRKVEKKERRKFAAKAVGLLAVIMLFVALFGPYPIRVDPFTMMGFSLTAFSILFGFYLTIIADRKLQIGRTAALFLWIAITLLLLSALGNAIVSLYGVNTRITAAFSNAFMAAAIVMGVVLIPWALDKAFEEGRK